MQWRELIREKLKRGWTEQQIKDYFVQQYGDRVLATPPAVGLELAGLYPASGVNPTGSVYPLPGAAQLEARRRPAARAAPETPPASQDEYVARLEEELRKS